MKRVFVFLTLLMALAPAMCAQEHYTEGPVWRIQLIRVKPTKMDAYLASLRQATKPLIEEQSGRLGHLRGHSIQELGSLGWRDGQGRGDARQNPGREGTGPGTGR